MLRLRTDAGNDAHGHRIEERLHRVGRDHRQTVRLLDVGRDLRDELVRPDADRAREPFALDDLGLQRASVRRRRVERLTRAEIEIGFVDARLFELIGAGRENRHDAPGDFGVEAPVTRNEDRLRFAATPCRLGETPRSRDWRRRPDTVAPRQVIRGRDHAAAVSIFRVRADNERLASQRGVVTLLDRGVVRVHVDVRDDPHRACVVGARAYYRLSAPGGAPWPSDSTI